MDLSLQPESPVGLIAGMGRCPLLAARGIRASGRRLVVVALRGAADERLRELADEFHWAGIVRLGQWIRILRAAGAKQAVMIGGVPKSSLYTPWRLARYIPDWRTMRLYYGKLRKDRRDHALLLGVADELAGEGIQLVSSVEYCKEHLAGEGPLNGRTLSAELRADAEFGWRIARASAELDIGQSLAVKERIVIAVEAIEGTDAMIARAGGICRTGGWTMVKVARPRQDMRFDVPTIGPQTIRNLRDAGCACLVVESGKTIIVDKPVTLELAAKLGIAVVGMSPGEAG